MATSLLSKTYLGLGWSHYGQGCDLTNVNNPGKSGSRPGCPFALEDKSPWTSWMFSFGGYTDSPHHHKQETRGLDTIQATSFFPWWLLLFFQKHLGKGKFVKNPEIRKYPEKSHACMEDYGYIVQLSSQCETFQMFDRSTVADYFPLLSLSCECSDSHKQWENGPVSLLPSPSQKSLIASIDKH